MEKIEQKIYKKKSQQKLSKTIKQNINLLIKCSSKNEKKKSKLLSVGCLLTCNSILNYILDTVFFILLILSSCYQILSAEKLLSWIISEFFCFNIIFNKIFFCNLVNILFGFLKWISLPWSWLSAFKVQVLTLYFLCFYILKTFQEVFLESKPIILI